jgi:hypothetical protein
VPTVERVPYRTSAPLRAWRGRRRALLDRLAAGASSEPLVEGYVVRVVAEFQGFARDLHDLGALRLVELASARQRHVEPLTRAATLGRRLDATNPTLETLTRDFARLGLEKLDVRLARSVPEWPDVRRDLRLLLSLRNAIAHGDRRTRDSLSKGGANMTVAWIGIMRTRLDAVATATDYLLWNELRRTYGREPW